MGIDSKEKLFLTFFLSTESQFHCRRNLRFRGQFPCLSAILCSQADSLCSCCMGFWTSDCHSLLWITTKVVYSQCCSVVTGWGHVELLSCRRTFWVHHATVQLCNSAVSAQLASHSKKCTNIIPVQISPKTLLVCPGFPVESSTLSEKRSVCWM